MTSRVSHNLSNALLRAPAIFALLLLAGCNSVLPLRAPAGMDEAQRGISMLQQGDRSHAIPLLDSAVKAAGSDPRVVREVAGNCLELRDWELAARYGEIALKQIPGSDRNSRWEALGLISTAYIGLNQRDRALNAAKEGFNIEPEDPKAMNLLGYTYADAAITDKLPDALALTQKAVETAASEGRPESETALYLDSVGWVKFQMGRIDEAITDLSRAAEILPRQPDVLYHLGRSYFKKGKYSSASILFQRALKLSPRFTEAEQALKETLTYIPAKAADADSDKKKPGPAASPLTAPHVPANNPGERPFPSAKP